MNGKFVGGALALVVLCGTATWVEAAGHGGGGHFHGGQGFHNHGHNGHHQFNPGFGGFMHGGGLGQHGFTTPAFSNHIPMHLAAPHMPAPKPNISMPAMKSNKTALKKPGNQGKHPHRHHHHHRHHHRLDGFDSGPDDSDGEAGSADDGSPSVWPAEAVVAEHYAYAEDVMPRQVERLLRVQNNTGEKLTVWVQYHTLEEDNQWSWRPADPTTSKSAARFDISVDQDCYLRVSQERIHADRTRIWARTESGRQFQPYVEEDHWLVPEVDESGDHYYLASEMMAFTFRFGATSAASAAR